MPIPVGNLSNLCGLLPESCVSTSLLALLASRVGTSLSYDKILAKRRMNGRIRAGDNSAIKYGDIII